MEPDDDFWFVVRKMKLGTIGLEENVLTPIDGVYADCFACAMELVKHRNVIRDLDVVHLQLCMTLGQENFAKRLHAQRDGQVNEIKELCEA